MSTADSHGLGYERVDVDPHVTVLVDTMTATAGWDATRTLRSWERTRLGLAPGDRLLDVGCGLGEAALALADDLGDTGEVVGVDRSSEMLTVARAGAANARCRVRFSAGDACALDEPDAAFDAARCERTLQWLTDPEAAVAELVRVVRPGGRVSLIDTDWSTYSIDVGDARIATAVHETMRVERRRPSTVGRRLHHLVEDAGCVEVERATATQRWAAWDPDASPAPVGCFSMESLVDDVIAAGHLAPAERDDVVSTIHTAARGGRFAMTLTMFAVVARRPS